MNEQKDCCLKWTQAQQNGPLADALADVESDQGPIVFCPWCGSNREPPPSQYPDARLAYRRMEDFVDGGATAGYVVSTMNPVLRRAIFFGDAYARRGPAALKDAEKKLMATLVEWFGQEEMPT